MAFPGLAHSAVLFIDPADDDPAGVPPADVSIATLWTTAYSVAHARQTRRRFYLVQDFEPMFYPAGTSYALAEESYRLGLYGLCNSQPLLDRYESDYRGTGMAFTPAVDRTVFHPEARRPLDHEGPVRIFLYSRPGHWRNCWELASLALNEIKRRRGDSVHIVTAGSWARPEDLGTGIEHRGLLEYRDTGDLFRSSDIGMALTVSRTLFVLAARVARAAPPVVAFDNSAGGLAPTP